MCKMLPISLAMLNVAWFLSPPRAFAQCDPCYYWDALFGEWTDGGNWVHEEWDDDQQACVEVAGVPGCADCVLLDFAGIDVHGSACANTVKLEASGMDVENGGALSVLSELDVDYMSQVNQWAGSSANLNTLTVSHYSTAEYFLRGGTLHADWVTLGVFGSGTLWQSAGSNAVSYGIALGTGSGGLGSGTGTYVLEAGDLSTGFLHMGLNTDSVGRFVQTGGRNTVTGEGAFHVGLEPGASGRYELSGTGELNTRWAAIGYWGSGTFIQTGGTHTLTGDGLFVGAEIDSSGWYELGGTGELKATLGIVVGNRGSGSFLQSGGLLQTRYLNVGLEAPGAFTQTGGSNTITGFEDGQGGLIVAHDPYVEGSYELGGDGHLWVNAEAIGWRGRGTFVQTGGTHSVMGDTHGHLTLGAYSGSDGRYELSGDAQLCTRGITVGEAGSGTFVHTGGTYTVTGEWAFLLGTQAESNGRYELSGTGQLNTRWAAVGCWGTGTFIQTGGRHTLTGDGLYVGAEGGSEGTYELSGSGVLDTTWETVGNNGTGRFIQSGGINNSVRVTVGRDAIGTFIQTGGTHSVMGEESFFMLGTEAGSDGRYELRDGTLSVGGSALVGNRGTGAFTHTAGTNTVADDLWLGHGLGSVGTYELGGSGELSARRAIVGFQGTGTLHSERGDEYAHARG